MSLDVSVKFLLETRQALQAMTHLKHNIDSAMGNISRSIQNKLVGGAGLYGAFKFFKNAVDEVLHVGDVANRFRLPIEEVGTFTTAIKRLGGETSDATNLIEQFQMDIAQLRTEGKGRLLDFAPRLGLNLGAIRNYQDMLRELRRTYQMLRPQGKTMLEQAFGFTSPATLALLRMTNDEFDAYLAKSKELNNINQDTYNLMYKGRMLLSDLGDSVTRAGMSVVNNFSEEIEKAEGLLKKFSEMDKKQQEKVIKTAGTGLLLKSLGAGNLPATLGATITYGVQEMGAEKFFKEWGKLSKEWLSESLRYAWGAFVGENFGGKDPYEALEKAIKDLKRELHQAPEMERFAISTKPTSIQKEVMQSGAPNQSQGLLLQGNTFYVNVPDGDANSFIPSLYQLVNGTSYDGAIGQ